MAVAPIVIAAALDANLDGTLRTTNPNGDFLSSAILNVNQAQFAAALGTQVGKPTGSTALSLNLRGAWLTGSQAATCTFSLSTVSGDSASAAGFSISGATFAQPYTSADPGGVFELFAVASNGQKASFGRYSWSIVTVSGTDALAPTIPTNLQLTSGTGAINLSFDAASDRYDGAIAPSGMASYQVFLDGASSPATTISAPIPNRTPAAPLQTLNIGTASPAGTASQLNGVWTLTAAGIGLQGTVAEEILFVGAPLSGDATLIAKLDAYSSTGSFSTSGIILRENNNQGAIFGAIYLQPQAGALGFQVKVRSADNTTASNIGAKSGATSGWVKIERVGAQVTFSYSLDGNTWTQLAVTSLTMGTTAQWGIFLSSQVAGVTCTSTIREVNLNQAPTITGTVTAAAGTHTVQVSAVDVIGNPSAKCPAVSGTSASSGGGGGTPTTLNWHPGIYPCFNYFGGVTLTHWNNSDKSTIAGTAPGDGLAGFQIQIYWNKIDIGTTGTTPSYDWSLIENFANACAAVGKRLWVQFMDGAISSGWSVAAGNMETPKWLAAHLGGAQNCNFNYADPAGSGNPHGVLVKRYDATTNGYWINFVRDFVAKYDNDSRFEGFTIYEETAMSILDTGSSVSTSTPGADYTDKGMFDQLLRVIAAVRDPAQINCQKMQVCIGANYLFKYLGDNNTLWQQILDALVANKMGFGGPDTWQESWTYQNTPFSPNYPQQNEATANNPSRYRNLTVDAVMRGWYPPGYTAAGTKQGLTFGASVQKDYRGKILFAPLCELTDMGGYITWTMTQPPRAQDLWLVRGPKLDNCHYFMPAILNKESGYVTGQVSQHNWTPACAWNVDSTSVYPWIKSAKPQTNQVSPYT